MGGQLKANQKRSSRRWWLRVRVRWCLMGAWLSGASSINDNKHAYMCHKTQLPGVVLLDGAAQGGVGPHAGVHDVVRPLVDQPHQPVGLWVF